MPDKVYLITTGEYEDYRTLCIFSTRKAAEEYRDIHNSLENYLDVCSIAEEILYSDGKEVAGPYLSLTSGLNWEGEIVGTATIVMAGPIHSKRLNDTITAQNSQWVKKNLTWTYVVVKTTMLQTEADVCRARHADKVDAARKKILNARAKERLDKLQDIL